MGAAQPPDEPQGVTIEQVLTDEGDSTALHLYLSEPVTFTGENLPGFLVGAATVSTATQLGPQEIVVTMSDEMAPGLDWSLSASSNCSPALAVPQVGLTAAP